MTSNRPREHWGKLSQDVPTADAVLNHFHHHATVIAITGESYRHKDTAIAKTKYPATTKASQHRSRAPRLAGIGLVLPPHLLACLEKTIPASRSASIRPCPSAPIFHDQTSLKVAGFNPARRGWFLLGR